MWLVDLAQLPDPSSLLPLLQHGCFPWAAIFQKKSAPSCALCGLQLPLGNVQLLWCGILSMGCRAICAPPWPLLWAAGESTLASGTPPSLTLFLLWLLTLPPPPYDILPFKCVFRGTANLADEFTFGLQWVCCGTSYVQHRAAPDFSQRPPLHHAATKTLTCKPNAAGQSRFYTVKSTGWISNAALTWKASSRVGNGCACTSGSTTNMELTHQSNWLCHEVDCFNPFQGSVDVLQGLHMVLLWKVPVHLNKLREDVV